MHDFSQAMVLSGPTGSGKSALALELAEVAHAEIIVMDSMTLYRGMDIGTAKPSPADQQRIPHHMLDVLDPWESGSVAWWLEQVQRIYHQILDRGNRVLFVGGTPLYMKALWYGLFDAPKTNPQLRQRLEAEATQLGGPVLHQRLAEFDPLSASRLHPNDVRRIVRALEVFETTGQPISELQTSWQSAQFQCQETKTQPPCLGVILSWPRPQLYQRIDQRVLAMLAAGWVQETQSLLELPKPMSVEASGALGYSLIQEYLTGELTEEKMIEWIQIRTRQFAKRQLTWFRKMSECQTIDAQFNVPSEKLFNLWRERSCQSKVN